LNLMW